MYQANDSLKQIGAASGNANPTNAEVPASTSPAAGPAAVVTSRPRRPDIHTSVVSTNTDGMPKYTRKPAAGTRRPACLVARAWPNSWQANAITFSPSSSAAPATYESLDRNTDCSPVNHWYPNANSPSSATA